MPAIVSNGVAQKAGTNANSHLFVHAEILEKRMQDTESGAGATMKCIYCNLINAWYYSTPLKYT